MRVGGSVKRQMRRTTPQSRPDGSQSIGRAVSLLAMVAQRTDAGARLSEVAEAAGLHIATARRILQALVAEGLLAFDSGTKIYAVGPAIFSFAVQGNPWFSRRELFVPALDRIAHRTRDTVMFSIRSGVEAVCLARHEGAFPIRVMSLETGSRRPLGAGSGSLAILAFLPKDERTEILKMSALRYEPFRLSVEDLTEGIAEARKCGFAFNPGRIIEGVYGIGVPILAEGVAVAAVSVATIASRMDKVRRQEVVDIIRDEVASIPGSELPAVLAAPQPKPDKVA